MFFTMLSPPLALSEKTRTEKWNLLYYMYTLVLAHGSRSHTIGCPRQSYDTHSLHSLLIYSRNIFPVPPLLSIVLSPKSSVPNVCKVQGVVKRQRFFCSADTVYIIHVCKYGIIEESEDVTRIIIFHLTLKHLSGYLCGNETWKI